MSNSQISQELFEKIIANDLQGITVQDGRFRPVEDCLMSDMFLWQLEFHLNVHRGMRLLRALIRADEETNSQMEKYHENYVRINYPEEYKKYKEGM